MIHISQKDRFVVFLPLFHSFTFTVCAVLPLLRGSMISLLPGVSVTLRADALSMVFALTASLVPRVWEAPGLLTMMIFCPRAGDMTSANKRALISLPPPGGVSTICSGP